MTHLLHKLPDAGPFGERVQRAELEYLSARRPLRKRSRRITSGCLTSW